MSPQIPWPYIQNQARFAARSNHHGLGYHDVKELEREIVVAVAEVFVRDFPALNDQISLETFVSRQCRWQRKHLIIKLFGHRLYEEVDDEWLHSQFAAKDHINKRLDLQRLWRRLPPGYQSLWHHLLVVGKAELIELGRLDADSLEQRVAQLQQWLRDLDNDRLPDISANH